MANRIELFVDVDPTGRGAAAIRSITAQIGNVGSATQGVNAQGSLLGTVFAGNALYNFFRRGADAAIDFGRESIEAYGKLAEAERFLNAQAKETDITFAQSVKNADSLAQRLALSHANAERLYAVTLQFTRELGKPGQAQDFANKLADLLASHGVSPEQQGDITRSLLAGRATELAKVLGENVNAIEKQAAAAGGFADFAKLDDATKKLLLFNEVMRRSEENTGAADDRLRDADGLLANLSATYDRAKESAGRFLLTQTAVGDALRELISAFGGQGGGTPEQVAAERYAANYRAALAEAKKHADELQAQGENSHKQALIAGGKASEFEDFSYLVASRGKEQAEQLRTYFVNQYESLFKDKQVDLITLTFAERQFQHIKGIFDPAKQEEITKSLREMFGKFEREAASYLKGIRAQAEGLFDTLAQRYAGEGDNPFVKIFTDADTTARKLEKTFGVLGDTTVKQLQAIEDAHTRQSVLAAQLDATLQAADLRRRAVEIGSLKPGEFSAQEERAISILERRLDAVRSTAELDAKITALSQGLGKGGLQEALDKSREGRLGQEFRQLQGLLNNVSGNGRAATEERTKIYERVAQIFEELSPETQRRISRGQVGGRDAFIQAYQGLREAQGRRIQTALDQSKYQDEQIDNAQKDIETINKARRAGLDPHTADARLLRRLQDIPENALNPDLRRAGSEAFTREADRQDNLQKQGLEAQKQARESTDKLTAAIDNLAKQSQNPENRKLLIEILNRSRADVKDDLYGSLQPLPADPGSNPGM